MYQPDTYNKTLFSFINIINEIEEKAFQNERLSKDLTYTEVHVLYELGKYNAPQPMNILAQDLSITHPSLTALVDRIEEKGYLKRVRDENDRRVIYLELTHKGKTLNNWHTLYHKNLVKKIKKILNPEEEKSFFNTLEKLNKAIDYHESNQSQ